MRPQLPHAGTGGQADQCHPTVTLRINGTAEDAKSGGKVHMLLPDDLLTRGIGFDQTFYFTKPAGGVGRTSRPL